MNNILDIIINESNNKLDIITFNSSYCFSNFSDIKILFNFQKIFRDNYESKNLSLISLIEKEEVDKLKY